LRFEQKGIGAGTILFSGDPIADSQKLTLAPWDLAIVEEQ